jgi:Mitochondrial carrier protein
MYPLVDKNARHKFGISWQTARSVILNEGGVRALYRGLVPNFWGNALGWAFYFALYGELKDRIGEIRGGPRHLTFWEYFSASAAAGLLSSL